jgi:hypothetical protein
MLRTAPSAGHYAVGGPLITQTLTLLSALALYVIFSCLMGRVRVRSEKPK